MIAYDLFEYKEAPHSLMFSASYSLGKTDVQNRWGLSQKIFPDFLVTPLMPCQGMLKISIIEGVMLKRNVPISKWIWL